MSGAVAEPHGQREVSVKMADFLFPRQPPAVAVSVLPGPPALPYRLVAASLAAFVRGILPRLWTAEAMTGQSQIKVLLLLGAIEANHGTSDRASEAHTRELCESLSRLLLPALAALSPGEQIEYRAWLRWYVSESSK